MIQALRIVKRDDDIGLPATHAEAISLKGQQLERWKGFLSAINAIQAYGATPERIDMLGRFAEARIKALTSPA